MGIDASLGSSAVASFKCLRVIVPSDLYSKTMRVLLPSWLRFRGVSQLYAAAALSLVELIPHEDHNDEPRGDTCHLRNPGSCFRLPHCNGISDIAHGKPRQNSKAVGLALDAGERLSQVGMGRQYLIDLVLVA